jgi:uncharacterized membrane protein
MSTTQAEPPKKSFLIWNLIGQGWQTMKKNVWELLGLQVALLVLFFLLLGLINLLLPSTPDAAWYFRLANTLADWLVSYCFSVGIITLSLQFADQRPVTFTDFFSKMQLVVIYFWASFLAGLCTLLGLICFIVPGIIIGTRFSLFGYLIVDKNMGPVQALQESWRLVKGATWRVLGFWLASFLVTILGVLCLGVGLLFAFPTTAIAGALLYRALWNQSQTTTLTTQP